MTRRDFGAILGTTLAVTVIPITTAANTAELIGIKHFSPKPFPDNWHTYRIEWKATVNEITKTYGLHMRSRKYDLPKYGAALLEAYADIVPQQLKGLR